MQQKPDNSRVYTMDAMSNDELMWATGILNAMHVANFTCLAASPANYKHHTWGNNTELLGKVKI